MDTPQIFLDLDGVMADFEGHFLKQFGVPHDSFNDAEMWKKINSVQHYFLDMEVMEGAYEFFNYLEQFNPIILTACPRSNYQAAAIQKRQWVRKNLSQDIMILPILGGKNKAMFIHQEGDILIDDMAKNCNSWTEHGGYAIMHTDFENTKNQLEKALCNV